MEQTTRSSWIYKTLIVGAAAVWGLSFVVMKDALTVMHPAWLLGLRFAATALILAVFWYGSLRAHLDAAHLGFGALLGFVEGIAYLLQNYGLLDTTPGRNAFLTATYCVMVPFLWWLFARRRPHALHIVAACVCLVGVALLSLPEEEGYSLLMGRGDLLSLAGALFFGVHIVLVSSAKDVYDIKTLTVIQMAGISFVCVVWPLMTRIPFELPELKLDFIVQMVYLVIFASCLAMGVQNIAQQHLPASQASILLSTESVFGVFFGVLLYHEALTGRLLLGFCLIFAAILLSEWAGNVQKN